MSLKLSEKFGLKSCSVCTVSMPIKSQDIQHFDEGKITNEEIDAALDRIPNIIFADDPGYSAPKVAKTVAIKD